jgi:hypothetical protein
VSGSNGGCSILEVATITQQDVYSMGGHSSPFDQLVAEAADLVFGRPASEEEREAILLKAEHIRSEAGPMWLTAEATQRVVTRMKPHSKRLREIKQRQGGP